MVILASTLLGCVGQDGDASRISYRYRPGKKDFADLGVFAPYRKEDRRTLPSASHFFVYVLYINQYGQLE